MKIDDDEVGLKIFNFNSNPGYWYSKVKNKKSAVYINETYFTIPTPFLLRHTPYFASQMASEDFK